jgi:predicted PurR-regulated permease PerM
MAGEIGRALVVAILGFAIVSSVDNFLRPILLSGSASMNGLVVFVSLLGGIAAFGAIGLVLGPVVIATAITILRLYAESSSGASASEADS